MRILIFFTGQLLSSAISAEEQPDWLGALLNRIEYLERKDAEKDAIIAEQQKEIESVKAICSGSKTDQEKLLNEPSERRRFVLNEGPVAFTAAITPYVVDHLKSQEIVKFETIITSIGGGYNNQSGVFVVPVSGIYMISCSLLDDDRTGLMVHGEIVQDHRVLGRVFAHTESRSYRDQGTQTVFTHAHAGDQIWVRVKDNADLGLGGELYSSFSGYLLYAME
ncbi:complement C1q-like protein 3 isoform X2 [Mercenaria mercenaria]|uniref:complement C1q-like protein 3 isoform X2 n=1 Tax=Mercenaria mercenaria TaxID=6596 RepID=UPI00234F414B|nr:complement C1q-like protein 3 isoform X2 [Mercenaria mercenaria]